MKANKKLMKMAHNIIHGHGVEPIGLDSYKGFRKSPDGLMFDMLYVGMIDINGNSKVRECTYCHKEVSGLSLLLSTSTMQDIKTSKDGKTTVLLLCPECAKLFIPNVDEVRMKIMLAGAK